jgi:hypothetical protein
MTSFPSPVGPLTYENRIVYSDFITGLDEWGWTRGNTPEPTLTISNTSVDALGVVTLGCPALSNTLYGRSGLFLAQSATPFMDRNYLSARSPIKKRNVFQCRVKSNTTSLGAEVVQYCGMGLDHAGKILYDGKIARFDKGIGFHNRGDEPFWVCAIWWATAPLFELTTTIPKSNWNTLRIEWTWLNETRSRVQVDFFINHSVVASTTIEAEEDFATMLHSIQTRDKTGASPVTSGSGRSDQTIDIDYMYAEIPSYRNAARP